MSRISKEIDKMIKLWRTKDEIKEALVKDFAEISVANELKSYPEPVEFLKYKTYNNILLGCLWFILVINCLVAFSSLGILWIMIASILPLLFIYFIRKWKSGAYLWLMIMIAWSGSKLWKSTDDLFQGDIIVTALTLLYLLAFILAFCLAFYLSRKLFPSKKSA